MRPSAFPTSRPGRAAVYHLYVIRTGDRDGMMNHLKEAGIGTGIHYPIPLHLQKAYASLNYERGDFPVAERVAAEIVSLPMFPQLTAGQQSRVVEELTGIFLQEPARGRTVNARLSEIEAKFQGEIGNKG